MTTETEQPGTPTARTTSPKPEHQTVERLSAGDFYTEDSQQWAFTFEQIETATSFKAFVGELDGQYSMPSDKQLAFAKGRFRNISPQSRSLYGLRFALLHGSEIYQYQYGFEHPAYHTSLNVSETSLDKEYDFYFDLPSHDEIESGKTITRWVPTVTPRELSPSDLNPAYDKSEFDSQSFSVVWDL
ncbi:MAG: hypothetical protein ABEI77_07490 [Halorientalis sp.]